MPKMNIYVSDDLKTRMDEVESANWSAVAQRAFERELQMRKEVHMDNITTVADRLKASREDWFEGHIPAWKEAGATWAGTVAEYAALLALEARVEQHTIDGVEAALVAKIACGDDGLRWDDITEFWQRAGGSENDGYPAYDFVAAWVEGALEVFEQAKEHMD